FALRGFQFDDALARLVQRAQLVAEQQLAQARELVAAILRRRRLRFEPAGGRVHAAAPQRLLGRGQVEFAAQPQREFRQQRGEVAATDLVGTHLRVGAGQLRFDFRGLRRQDGLLVGERAAQALVALHQFAAKRLDRLVDLVAQRRRALRPARPKAVDRAGALLVFLADQLLQLVELLVDPALDLCKALLVRLAQPRQSRLDAPFDLLEAAV